jgi:oligosaccharide repeat unit polymerase
MDATWPASAAVGILMIVQAQLARRQLGGWLAPGALFCLTWTTATVSSLLIAPEYRIWPGVLWVFFMTCTAHLGGLLVTAEPATLIGPEPEEPLRTPPAFPLLLPLLCVSAALEVAGAIYLVYTIGKNFHSLLSLSGISEISSHFTGARYTDPDFREPTPFLVAQAFIDFAGFLGGALFAQTRSKTRRAIALVPVPVVLLATLVLGARTTVVNFGLCWVSAYCAIRAYAGYRSPWSSARRAFATMVLAIVAFTSFYVVVQFVREDLFEGRFSFALSQEKIIDYGLGTAKNEYVGYLGAFSKWFSENWDRSDTPGLGVNSFDGPAGWFGYKIVRNPEPIQLTPGVPASQTNIFSMFRHMALDWTLPGSALFLFLISVGASLAYTRVRAGSIACIPFTAMFYWIALRVTDFALRSTVSDLAWVMFALYLWIACSPGPEPEF